MVNRKGSYAAGDARILRGKAGFLQSGVCEAHSGISYLRQEWAGALG